jgi:hypothetical protein
LTEVACNDEDVSADEKCKTGSGKAGSLRREVCDKKPLTRSARREGARQKVRGRKCEAESIRREILFAWESIAGNLAPIHVKIVASD